MRVLCLLFLHVAILLIRFDFAASNFYKPLSYPAPDHDRDSVLSSLTPSQSASQIGAAISQPVSLPPYEKPYRLDIPAAHQMSENSTIPGPSTPTSREPDYSNSSSEDEGPVEVHENPHFQPASILNRQRTVRTAPPTPVRSSPVPFPNGNKVHSASSDAGPPTSTHGTHGRKGTGIFGSIASLFRTSMNNKATPTLSGTKWSTRTDNNIRNVKTDGEDSSNEEVPRIGRLRKARGRSAPRHDVGQSNTMLISSGTSPLPISSPSVRIKNMTSGGKLRSGTGGSNAVEPASAPRIRANTLTLSSSGGVLVDAQGPNPRSHGKRASMDGRWGLTDPGTMPSSYSVNSSSVWKPPKQSTASRAGSLMSIVEGVSHSAQDDDPSSTLEVVRAPGNAIAGLPILVHHPPPLPTTASAPASLVQTSVAQKRSSLPNPPTPLSTRNSLSAREKKPLRSAMRNPNRDRSISPSPSASPNSNAADAEQLPATISPLSLPGPALPSLRPSSTTRPEIPSTIIESPRQSVVNTTDLQANTQRQSYISVKTDDSASISSYETGHEDFDDEALELNNRPAPLATPPANGKMELPPQSSSVLDASPLNGMSDDITSDRHEVSSATSTDTAIGATPTRRKSVRMSSLPPQFSATPPALEEEDEYRSPWGGSSTNASERDGGWKTRISTSNAAWDDSSSEDEMYKSARKALSRADRRSEKQNAAKLK